MDNKQDLYEKLVRLEETKKDVKAMKKAAAKDYNDQLKDIEAEILDTIDLIKGVDC